MAKFLQALVVLIGLAALAFLLLEPHLEGRNAHATLFEIYFKDPFLAYAYAASIPFFAALCQAFRALGDAGRALRALHIIRYCALATIGFVALGEVFIILGESDDRAGGVFMGVLAASGSAIVAAAAARLERSLRNAGDKGR